MSRTRALTPRWRGRGGRSENRGAAERALERALDVAGPDHARLYFLLHPVRGLLERHARHRTAHAALIADILTLLAPGSQGPEGPEENGEAGSPTATARGRTPGSRASGLTEPLTQAESRVLRYLPTHLTVPEIGNLLYLSVNTVRTHLRHVYDKLGAHGRHEAVERARALGLLASSSRGS